VSDKPCDQAHGAPLWVNVRALAEALRDPDHHKPYAYLERQAIDDLCIYLCIRACPQARG
jgi:hypothetical protein